MVKIEHQSSSTSSDSDNGIPSTPLAASTQIATHGRFKGDLEDQSSESDHSDKIEQLPKSSTASRSLDNSMQKYLNKFSNVRLSKPRYNVDIDLTDPDDELYLVTCPTSIDARKVLLNAEISIPLLDKVSQIESASAGSQLEAYVSGNSANNPVTILVGKQLKSFIPKGTIQIRESLEKIQVPRVIKPELTTDEVPFPEVIRERHPLLGLHYKPAQKMPKHVRKALSVAQQRANMWYLQNGKNIKTDLENGSGKSKKRKRQDSPDPLAAGYSSGDAVPMLIKHEKPSPSKKLKKEKLSEPAVEDDLSWLQNI
ncbi:uncharacterized protein LOC128732514 [Sabethes cyaneus]|uniref:uncharacterized protein LOC128732514 n=1 Tax=Sabethes cyaneus TaxID=53552 RepID=UPI00237ECF5B|nr:uncharacterized protein LOC128732514 [Sabethes cyaneus]